MRPYSEGDQASGYTGAIWKLKHMQSSCRESVKYDIYGEGVERNSKVGRRMRRGGVMKLSPSP